MIKSYKSHFLSQFSNGYFLPRNQETLQKIELTLYHGEIARQSREWQFENAINICLQFSFLLNKFSYILMNFPHYLIRHFSICKYKEE